MSNKIKHVGIVDSVEGGCVRVRILQHSACSSCKAAMHCNASETREKVVEVQGAPQGCAPGDRVVVMADASVGFRASLYGYLLPLLLMVLTLAATVQFTGSEGAAALSAIGILVPYYIGLYLLRDRLRQKLSFGIEKEQ